MGNFATRSFARVASCFKFLHWIVTAWEWGKVSGWELVRCWCWRRGSWGCRRLMRTMVMLIFAKVKLDCFYAHAFNWFIYQMNGLYNLCDFLANVFLHELKLWKGRSVESVSIKNTRKTQGPKTRTFNKWLSILSQVNNICTKIWGHSIQRFDCYDLRKCEERRLTGFLLVEGSDWRSKSRMVNFFARSVQ